MAKVHLVRQGFLTKSTLPNVSRISPGTPINSQLLLLGDGPNGSTTFTDSSVNNYTVTRFGDAVISTAQFPTGMSSSILLDGNVDRLGIPSFTLTGNFTIECYVYLTTAQANWRMLCGQPTSDPYFAITSTGLEFQFGFSAATVASCTQTFSLNTWFHIAAVRNGSVVSFYVNGVSRPVTNSSQTNNFIISSIGNAFQSNYGFIGYISNFRVTPAAVYISNFTPTALPLANNVPISQSSLLMLGSGTNGSTSITDSSLYNNTITNVGSPVISTASFPTGMTSSIYLASGASYLRMPHNATLFNFAANFTIEFWINYSAHDNFGGIFAAGGTGVWSGLQVQFDGTSDRITVQGNYATLFTPTTTLPRNTWNHVALSRVSGVMRLFFNGTQVGSLNNSASFSNSGSFVYVGSERSPGLGITGYLSNVRVFNTLGLYSANFTPQVPPLSASNNGDNIVTNNIYGVYKNR